MKPSHYLAIFLRVFSIFLLFYALQQSGTLITVLGTGGINGMNVSTLFMASTVVCPLFVAAILWLYPSLVSNVLLKPEIDLPIEPMKVKEILTIVILAITLYSLYETVLDTVYWATWWQMSAHSGGATALLTLDSETKANMVVTMLELIVSVVVLLNAKSLASKILKLAK